MAEKKSDELYAIRHSLAHIMATAIQKLWTEAKFEVGPPVENGFYYDVDLGKTTLTSGDLAKIEAEMHKEIAADHQFKKTEKSIAEAIKWAKQHKQDYKVELLDDLKQHGTTAAKDIE